MLQYRCNINYYYFAKIGWKNFQEDRGSWNRRNAKRLAIDRKHADKRITGHAGQGQMRHRVTAGRLGKLGLTLFALAGVFFSLFASVLDPVVWAAALDEDVPCRRNLRTGGTGAGAGGNRLSGVHPRGDGGRRGAAGGHRPGGQQRSGGAGRRCAAGGSGAGRRGRGGLGRRL